MSDILIKNMKMPANCFLCQLSYLRENRLFCYPTKDEVVRAKIADNCPIIEVPTPHGRLIDADAMSEKYGDWYTEEGTEEGFIGVLKYLIAEQQTIIEADRTQND